MTLIGLDLNATRVRAVIGPAGATPHALALVGAERELPTLVNLSGRHLEVGKSAAAICRQLPHLICANFLPYLGVAKEWRAGRHRLDSARALTTVFESLKPGFAAAKGIFAAIPDYLDREQCALLPGLAAKAKLSLLGSVSAPLAAALATYSSSPWSGLALVVDADDHALTCSLLASDRRDAPPAHIDEGDDVNAPTKEVVLHAATESTPSISRTHATVLSNLGVRAWKNRLMDSIADRCIRHSRRDPRDSASADQMVYEQLEEVLDACWQEQLVEIVVQGEHWCQNLVLRPEEIRAICGPLVERALDGMHDVFALAAPQGVRRVLITESAGRLPGLNEAMQDEAGSGAVVIPLAADAPALGAHELATHFLRGERPRQHLDSVISFAASGQDGKAPQRKRRLFGF